MPQQAESSFPRLALAGAAVLCLVLVVALTWAVTRTRRTAALTSAPVESTTPAAPVRTPSLGSRLPTQGTPTAAVSAPPSSETRAFRELFPKPTRLSREALMLQLADATTVSLSMRGKTEETAAALRQRVQNSALGSIGDPTLELIADRPDLVGLPWRRGNACRLSSSEASDLDRYSSALRGHTADPDELQRLMWGAKQRTGAWARPSAVPTLMQMLTPEDVPVRRTLISQLWRIEGKEASEALARIALFDPEPKIRDQAVGDLVKRPAGEYLQVLLSGFSHPWPAVANHAAEAIVRLRVTEAVPALVDRLDAPDPRDTYAKQGVEGRFVKEMVRVEHAKNCLLCHPPSFEKADAPRTTVPGDTPRPYYPNGNRTFVRADVSYLRQDYSVALRSEDATEGKARFDFFVRERSVAPAEFGIIRDRLADDPNPQGRAVGYALTTLTGRYLGPKPSDWKQLVAAMRKEPAVR